MNYFSAPIKSVNNHCLTRLFYVNSLVLGTTTFRQANLSNFNSKTCDINNICIACSERIQQNSLQMKEFIKNVDNRRWNVVKDINYCL